MNTISVIFLSCLFAFVASSFLEWVVHGPFMHGRFSTPRQRTFHLDHHRNFLAGDYKNHSHGNHVFLPWWAAVAIIGVAGTFGLVASLATERWSIVTCVTLVTAAHYWGYQYVHTCMHIPEGRWFEGTRLFRYLDARHRIHHERDQKFSEPTNIGLFSPLFDWIFLTDHDLRRWLGLK